MNHDFFESYEQRKARECANENRVFDTSELAPQFIQYFENGQRIEVETNGEIKRGRVGVTTGWKPVFLLMLRRSDRGSSWVLGKDDKVLRVISD